MLALELVIVLLAIFLGARLGGIGIGFAGIGRSGPGADRRQAGQHSFDVISIIMAVIAAISAMQVAGDGLSGAADRKAAAQEPQAHHHSRSYRHLLPDHLRRHRQHLALGAAGDRRSGERTGHQALPPAVDRRGVRPDRHHRLADLRRGGVYVFGDGRPRRQLPAPADGGDPVHLLRRAGDVAAGDLAVRLQTV